MNCNRRSVRWVFDCNKWYPTRQEWITASTSVQTEEKQRIGKFYFKRDAKNAMAGRLLIRKFLTMYSGLKWKDVEISRSDHGKPYFKNDTKLNFNISHQGGYAILAGEVGNTSVGCDVMTVEYKTGDRLSEFLRLMSKQLSEKECETIKNAKNTEKDMCRIFYRLWCLKESYTKALGTGITLNLGEISFDLKEEVNEEEFITSTELIVSGEVLKDWSFQEILIDKDTFAAVAQSPKIDPVQDKFQHLSFQELVQEAEPLIPVDEGYCDDFFRKANLP